MNFWKRFASGLGGRLDAVVARIENHDSLVGSAIEELRDNIASAEVRLSGVGRDGEALRRRLEDQVRAEAQWKERARRTLEDEERALECLRRSKRAGRAVADLQARLGEHERIEAGLVKDVRALREGLRDLEEQRNLMRARQNRADAMDAMRDDQGRLSGEVREILDRWEIQIKRAEYSSSCALESSDALEQSFNAEFGEGESMSLTFTGGWDRYKRLKQVTDPFGQEAGKLAVRTTLRADFSEGLDVASDQFQTIHEVFTTLGFGRMVIDAEPIEGS